VEPENESVEFNLHDAADELLSDEAQTESTQAAPTEGQLATDPANPVSEEQRAQDILDGKVVEEKPGAINPDLINQINSIGAIHNGLPIKVDSPEQLKELLQKGFDYTKKTMAHAEESRLKQEEFAKIENSFKEKETVIAQKEQELHAVSFQNNIVNSMVDKWKTADPELYAYIQQAFQNEISEFNKNQPLIAQYENKFKQFEEKFSQLEQGKQQEQLGSIKQSWETGLAELQTQRGARLKELGIVPNWDKVKEVWGADATGKMSHEQALLAVHGADMIKLAESQVKTLQSKNKVQSQKLGRSGVGYRQAAGPAVAVKNGDIMSMLRAEAEKF
jgi:hypothetical protein